MCGRAHTLERAGRARQSPVKRHRGEPGHTRDTHGTHGTHGRTRAHGSHGRTSQPSTQIQRHTRARKPRPTQQPQEQPQARSRPLLAGTAQYSTSTRMFSTGKKTLGGAGTHTGNTGHTGSKTPGEPGHTGDRHGTSQTNLKNRYSSNVHFLYTCSPESPFPNRRRPIPRALRIPPDLVP